MNEACHTAMDLAVEQLEKHGALTPFAVVLRTAGDLRLVALGPDVATGSGAEDLDSLRGILRSGAAQELYRATAVATAVTVRRFDADEPKDALRFEVEHQRSRPVTVFLPYVRRDDGYRFEDSYVEPGESILLKRV